MRSPCKTLREPVELLERDVKLLNALLAGMCRCELTEKGEYYLKQLIKGRRDDINTIKNLPDNGKGGRSDGDADGDI